MAIASFSDRKIERFFRVGEVPKRAGWRSVSRVAIRKLDMLDYARELRDLASPAGNRLELLRGNLRGLHSIRIDDPWRIVFRWTSAGARDVDIRDYHY